MYAVFLIIITVAKRYMIMIIRVVVRERVYAAEVLRMKITLLVALRIVVVLVDVNI